MAKLHAVIGVLGMAAVIGMASPAKANIIYNLDGVTLDDGGTLTGSFTTNDDVTSLISADIKSSSSSHEYIVPSLPNQISPGNAAVTAGSLSITDHYASPDSTYSLTLYFSTSLSGIGTFAIATGGVSNEVVLNGQTVTRNVATGNVIADPPTVPEPSSVVMVSSALAIGLGMMWRKRSCIAA